MKHLSRFDIEAIAEHIIDKYKQLPELQNTTIYRIEPELLITKVLSLKIDYQHLSLDDSILGMTSFSELGVEVFDGTDENTYYFLDGETLLIEKDLEEDISQKGRFNFTTMHEASHQVFKMLFPNEYGVRDKTPIHFCEVNSEKKKPIADWEEWQANTLAAAILLPKELVVQGMRLFNLGTKIKVLNKIYTPEVYKRFSALADFLGSSKTALAIRMKQLNLLEKEYLDNPHEYLSIYSEGVFNEG